MSMQAQVPKRALFFTVLLVLMTLAQAFGVFVIFTAWRDQVDHGQTGGLPLVGLPLAVAALVAVIGLWFWQRWAVLLFGLLALLGLLIDAVLGVGVVTLLVRAVLLGALFWQISEHRTSFGFAAVERSPVEEKELRERRRAAVRDLVELRVPVQRAVDALARFEWDSDEELHTLTRADALRLLERYQRHELTAEDCQLWAEALEGRDDLGLEDGFEDKLKEFLFEIATPELTKPLTPQSACRWERALTA